MDLSLCLSMSLFKIFWSSVWSQYFEQELHIYALFELASKARTLILVSSLTSTVSEGDVLHYRIVVRNVIRSRVVAILAAVLFITCVFEFGMRPPAAYWYDMLVTMIRVCCRPKYISKGFMCNERIK